MELTNRLKKIANFVDQGSIVADIGTDHGYIPIYLAQKGISKKIYAMDIHRGPLGKAIINIERNQVSEYVIPLLSDGILQLEDLSVDTIIIAGMGGMLIKKILLEGKKKLEKINKLILSPHLDTYQVRLSIHDLGYRIINEDLVFEDGKYYPVIVAVKGREKYEREMDYRFGKCLIDEKHFLLKDLLEKNKEEYLEILYRLKGLDNKNTNERKHEIEEKIAEIEEVMKCL